MYQALELLVDYVNKDDSSIRIGAIMVLGIAYAGTGNLLVNFLVFSPLQLVGHVSYITHGGCGSLSSLFLEVSFIISGTILSNQ